MISVIIPLYNKVCTIARTLETVFQQTYTDYEIVIVDDGSTDGSADVVRSIDDSRIHLISQANAGVSAARNRGIEEAQGEFVAFLDADDEWKPDYLETQMQLVEKYPQCNVFCSNYEFCNSTGKVTPTTIRRLPFEGEDGVLSNYFEVASHSHPPICSISIMVRKTAILSIGGFPLGIKSGEDLLTWARLAAQFKIAYNKKTGACAIFEGYEVTSNPKRNNDEDDYVGRELVALRNIYHPPYINLYISHWHKMRSSVFMRQARRKKSIAEALQGLRYHPCNYKLYIYLVLNLLPSCIQPFKR